MYTNLVVILLFSEFWRLKISKSASFEHFKFFFGGGGGGGGMVSGFFSSG